MTRVLREAFDCPSSSKLLAQYIAFGPFIFQAARSLRDLGVLKTLLHHPHSSFSLIQEHTKLNSYGLSLLLDAGVSIGLLEEIESKYALTPAGTHIESDPITQVNMNFTQDVCYQALASLPESLSQEIPVGLNVFGKWNTIYEGLTQLPERTLKSWLEFDHFYSDDALPKCLQIIHEDSPKRILDVGGNTGKFALACARHTQDSLITIVDHPSQLELAHTRITALNLAHRVELIKMNLLDHSIPLPSNQDVIWMSQFLDCFGKKDIVRLCERAREALSPQGSLYILEPFTDRQRHEASQLSLDMTSLYFACIANGNSRMYRFSDFSPLLGQAGLQIVKEYHPIRLSHTLLKCRKK